MQLYFIMQFFFWSLEGYSYYQVLLCSSILSRFTFHIKMELQIELLDSKQFLRKGFTKKTGTFRIMPFIGVDNWKPPEDVRIKNNTQTPSKTKRSSVNCFRGKSPLLMLLYLDIISLRLPIDIVDSCLRLFSMVLLRLFFGSCLWWSKTVV